MTSPLPGAVSDRHVNRRLRPASSSTAKLRAARQAAMEQARSLSQVTLRSPLCGGAAGYYSQVGRDHWSCAASIASCRVNVTVAAQSSASICTGVTVENGCTYSLDRGRNAWWNGLGENSVNGRSAAERASGFHINGCGQTWLVLQSRNSSKMVGD